MCADIASTTRLACAVHVDFDNVYLGLAPSRPMEAEDFARHPEDWMPQLIGLLGSGDGSRDIHRDILVARVYLNPGPFGKYRLSWLRAGFEVVDCPVLTSQGKTAADMTIAAEVLEEVHHTTRFDEFIVLSADADFAPIFRKLRLHDRRTVAVVAQNVAAPYAALCDRVVAPGQFLDVLGAGLFALPTSDDAA